ncbi:helix-turn-helix domain-containing protein [Nostoc sp.]|uniref:helix-turn-helix domain-containing protein n=1 Tax=Nostoc sp. TaxID=1180 RepID=UPI002FF1EFEE
MSSTIYDLPSDVGKTLSELRKIAKKKQADIAASINVAQSHISRIEKEKLTPTSHEIEGYVNAVGTKEAKDYLAFLKPWKILKRPSFRNPQRDELWKAELSLRELQKLISEGAPDFVMRQAHMYQNSVREEAEYLASLEHSIIYTGSIGVGKTTAVGKLTGLTIAQEKQLSRQSVLAVGTGRTTVCEVGIQCKEKFGIRIKPYSLDEINKLLEYLCMDSNSSNEEEQENQQEVVSQEIQRLLFNMAGLKRETFTELAKQHENPDTLLFKFSEMLKLQERSREEILFDKTSNQTGIEWLKETFRLINYGLHKDFSVPRRIDVMVPDTFFQSSNYDLEIIDTRGLDKDGTAIRRDLMDCLNNQRSLTVLCSRFNDAPGSEIRDLINTLIQNGSEKVLQDRVVILVLPKNDEAYNKTNDAGDLVDSKEEAYNLKREEVQTALQPLLKQIDVKDIPILFFNAHPEQDKPAEIAQALIEKLDKLRLNYVKRLSSTVEAINALIRNQKEHNAQKAYEIVSNQLKIFLDRCQGKPLYFGRIHDKLLIPEMRKTHAGTVRATTRRNGTLDKFDVYLLLGNGSKSVAWNTTMPIFHELKGILQNLIGDSLVKEYADNFVNEVLSNWDEWHQEFLTYSEQIGEQIFKGTLIKSDIWKECANIKGPGFRDEVISKLKRWFISTEQQHLHDLLNKRIEEAWQEKVFGKLNNLIGNVSTEK